MDINSQIERITAACYQQKDSAACGYIEEFIPELFGFLQKFQTEGENEKASLVLEIIKHIMAAMEAKDYVLVADYLKFELSPLL